MPFHQRVIISGHTVYNIVITTYLSVQTYYNDIATINDKTFEGEKLLQFIDFTHDVGKTFQF